MIVWIVAAVLVLCDGSVWSELGAACPAVVARITFLSRSFGRMRFGRLMPFLFIWQFLISGTWKWLPVTSVRCVTWVRLAWITGVEHSDAGARARGLRNGAAAVAGTWR